MDDYEKLTLATGHVLETYADYVEFLSDFASTAKSETDSRSLMAVYHFLSVFDVSKLHHDAATRAYLIGLTRLIENPNTPEDFRDAAAIRLMQLERDTIAEQHPEFVEAIDAAHALHATRTDEGRPMGSWASMAYFQARSHALAENKPH